MYNGFVVPFKIAVKLCQKGFGNYMGCLFIWENDETIRLTYPVHRYYNSRRFFSAPLYQQVESFFREYHNIHIVVIPIGKKKPFKYQYIIVGDKQNFKSKKYDSYYKCFIEAIKKALKLI